MGNSIPSMSSSPSQESSVGSSSGSTRNASRRSTSSNSSSNWRSSRGSGSRSKRTIKLVPRYGNPDVPFNTCPLVQQKSSSGGKVQPPTVEEIMKAKRLGLIQHLPQSVWESKSTTSDDRMTQSICECCICMGDFEENTAIRCLPCMHYYHVACIDGWLERQFFCPTCRQPVDAALLSTYA